MLEFDPRAMSHVASTVNHHPKMSSDNLAQRARQAQPENLLTSDTVELSDKVRGRAPHEYMVGLHSKTSVNSWMETFAGYNNSAAVDAKKDSIDSLSFIPALANIEHELDPSTYVHMGSEGLDVHTLTEEERLAAKAEKDAQIKEDLDKWLRGEEAFSLDMVGGVFVTGSYSSSDFFMLVRPEGEAGSLIDEARNALRFPPKTREEDDKVKELLKKVAELTPEDFSWWDCSGLQALTMEERESFRSDLNGLFDESGVDADANALRFSFTTSGDIDTIHGKSLSAEDGEKIKNMFNQYSGISEESRGVVDKLREMARRNSEIDWGLPMGEPPPAQ